MISRRVVLSLAGLIALLTLPGCRQIAEAPSALGFASAAASNTPAPPLARHIHGYGADGATTAARARFPVGSSESLMLAELAREHFVIKPATLGAAREALADWGGYPCRWTYELR